MSCSSRAFALLFHFYLLLLFPLRLFESTGFVHRCSLCGLQIGHDRERRGLAREFYKDRQGVRVARIFDRELSGHSPRSFLGMS